MRNHLFDVADHLHLVRTQDTPLAEEVRAAHEGKPGDDYGGDAIPWSLLTDVLRDSFRREREVLKVQLQLERESIYNEVDRLESEAELRAAIFLPLVALVVVATAQGSPWALVLVVLPASFLIQGAVSRRDADRRIAAAVVHGTVQSPTVEFFRRFYLANEVGPPVPREPPSEPLPFVQQLKARWQLRRMLRRRARRDRGAAESEDRPQV